MSSSRSRIASIAVLFVLVFAAAQPGTGIDVWIERALAPARGLAELARPFSWLAAPSVRAAETRLGAGASELVGRSRELLVRQSEAARPRDPALLSSKGCVHAEVVERRTKRADCVTIQFAPSAPVEADLPATHGDHFVGRVERLSRDRAGEAALCLVTEKSFRVGAEVVAADGRRAALVVGGVAPRPSDPRFEAGLFLSVHAPEDRTITSGTVRVKELASDPIARLADGFRLGELVRYDVDGVLVLAVRAELDYGAEPSSLALLVPAERSEAGTPLARDPFAAERWIAARCAVAGEASLGREARRILAGTAAEIERGAAVSVEGCLVGRIEHAGPWSSTARLAGDRGFRVHATAAFTGAELPRELGELESLGRDGDELLFLWRNSIEAGTGVLAAELFTSSAERGVPAGLSIGTCALPLARGVHVLRVEQPADGRALGRVRVWRPVLGRTDEEDEP